MTIKSQPSSSNSTNPTFKKWLTLVESLKDMTVSEEELAVIATMMGSDHYRQMASQANQINAVLTEIALNDSTWENLSSEWVMVLYDGHVALDLGLNSFLPARFAMCGHGERLGILFALLSLRSTDPWPAILFVITLDVLGAWADRELAKRSYQHVGTTYAAVPWMAEDELGRFLLRLCALSLNQTSRKRKGSNGIPGKKTGLLLDATTRSAIARALSGGKLEDGQHLALARIQSALAKVLGRRILGNPLQEMAKALDGKRNRNPEFVARQQQRDRLDENEPVFQYVGKGQKYRVVDVAIDSADHEGDTKQSRRPKWLPTAEYDEIHPPELGPLDLLVQQELAARERAFQEAVKSLCARKAKHGFGWRALQGEPLESLAKEAKTTRQAIARWRDRFKDELDKYLKNKYKHLFL